MSHNKLAGWRLGTSAGWHNHLWSCSSNKHWLSRLSRASRHISETCTCVSLPDRIFAPARLQELGKSLYRARGVILEAIYAPDEVWGRDYSKPRCRANMATLYTPTCSTCSERFPGPPSPKPNECLHFDFESCNLMCIYTVVTDPCHIPPLAQARPMMLCIYTSYWGEPERAPH